jgi:hypothetical protein
MATILLSVWKSKIYIMNYLVNFSKKKKTKKKKKEMAVLSQPILLQSQNITVER